MPIKLRCCIHTGCLDENDANLAKFKTSFRQLKIKDDIIYQVRQDSDRIVVPEALQNDVLNSVHNENFAGHFCLNKTYAKLKQYFYWPYMFDDAKNFIECCVQCQTWRKPKNNNVKTQPIHYENRIGFQIGIDFKGPLMTTKKDELYPVSHKFILLIIDHASKYIMAIQLLGQQQNSQLKLY